MQGHCARCTCTLLRARVLPRASFIWGPHLEVLRGKPLTLGSGITPGGARGCVGYRVPAAVHPRVMLLPPLKLSPFPGPFRGGQCPSRLQRLRLLFEPDLVLWVEGPRGVELGLRAAVAFLCWFCQYVVSTQPHQSRGQVVAWRVSGHAATARATSGDRIRLPVLERCSGEFAAAAPCALPSAAPFQKPPAG